MHAQAGFVRKLIQSLVLSMGALTACSAADAQEPSIVTDSPAWAFDEASGLSVNGLAPQRGVILRVEATDSSGTQWWSQAAFVTSADGRLDLSAQAPFRGTYEGVQPDGMFWSMVGGRQFSTDGDADLLITVSDMTGGVLDQERYTWLSPRARTDLLVEPMDIPHLDAQLYRLEDAPEPSPVVILLGGSGGGANEERAALLAARGYAVLDLAYFGTEGTPRYFVETRPLEHFMAAIDAVEADPRLDADRIAVMGRSYGGQLVLSWASYDARIDAVIADVPSSFVTGTAASYPFGDVVSAWSVDDKALAFKSSDDDPSADAMIPIEQIEAPILFVSGRDDRVWPSATMSEDMVTTLENAGFGHRVVHLSFDDAGHNFGGGEQSYGVPYLPPKDRRGRNGGSTSGNSVAAIEAWQGTLDFLETELRGTDR